MTAKNQEERVMLPIHVILHPTDFSEQSHHAFRLACALARDHGSRLVLLHVVPPPVAMAGEGLVLPAPDPADEGVWHLLHQLDVPTGILALRQVEQGDAAGEILRVAEEVNADLIVMGTHGRTGLPRLLMGSVAEKVLRRALCPVLVVKAPFPVTESVPAGGAVTANA